MPVLRLIWPLLLAACSLPALAQQVSPSPTDDPLQRKPAVDDIVHVTLGGRVKVGDITDMRGTLKLRPVIGLRYGRWRFGVGDASDWLRFSGYRKEATLSYDWLDSQRASLRLSLRVHNLATGEGVDAFEAGRHTLRGRAQFNYALTSRWSLGGELTHDLLDRGDGQTLGAGASYRWPLDPRRSIYFNGGVTWGSARHWQSAYAPSGAAAATLGPGLGALGLGSSYRHTLGPRWAWYASLGAARAIAGPARIAGSGFTWSSQVGVLYFLR